MKKGEMREKLYSRKGRCLVERGRSLAWSWVRVAISPAKSPLLQHSTSVSFILTGKRKAQATYQPVEPSHLVASVLPLLSASTAGL